MWEEEYTDEEKLKYVFNYIQQQEEDKELMEKYGNPEKIRKLLDEIRLLQSSNDYMREYYTEKMDTEKICIKLTRNIDFSIPEEDYVRVETLKYNDKTKTVNTVGVKINLLPIEKEYQEEFTLKSILEFITPVLQEKIKELRNDNDL